MKNLLFCLFILVSSATIHSQIISVDFEDGIFPPSDWTLSSQTTNSWQTFGAGAFENAITGALSARCKALSQDQDEQLISPVLDLSTYSSLTLNFKAYGNYEVSVSPNDFCDLNVLISTNNGATWSTVWSEHEQGFFPLWPAFNVSLDLSEYAGASHTQIAFQYTGNNGDAWTIDDIILSGSEITVSNENIKTDKQINIFPNPSTGIFQLSTATDFISEQYTIELRNIDGKLIKTWPASKDYNISELNNGLYIISVNDGVKTYTTTLIKH